MNATIAVSIMIGVVIVLFGLIIYYGDKLNKRE